MFKKFLKVLKHFVLITLGIMWAFAAFTIGWGLVYQEVAKTTKALLDFTLFIPLHIYSILRWILGERIALPISGILAIYLLFYLIRWLVGRLKRI